MRVIFTIVFSLPTLQNFGLRVLQGRSCASKTPLVAPTEAEHTNLTLS